MSDHYEVYVARPSRQGQWNVMHGVFSETHGSIQVFLHEVDENFAKAVAEGMNTRAGDAK